MIMEYFGAFVVCGLICLAGQLIYDNTNLTPGHITSLFVVLGAFLDFFNLYDKLVEFGHAGALLPITSFGHSLMHSVMDGVAQQGLLGIPLGMLDLTAAGITSAFYFQRKPGRTLTGCGRRPTVST